jgi:hypothetical protein
MEVSHEEVIAIFARTLADLCPIMQEEDWHRLLPGSEGLSNRWGMTPTYSYPMTPWGRATNERLQPPSRLRLAIPGEVTRGALDHTGSRGCSSVTSAG